MQPSVEETLHQCYGPMLRRAYSLLHNIDAAQDVVQDICLHLLSHPDILGTSENPQAYCMGMVRNQCLKQFRQASRTTLVDTTLLPDSLHPTTVVESPYLLDDLLHPLTPYARQVVILHDIEGYSCFEIALRLHRSVASIRKQLTRAHDTLYQHLNTAKS